MKKKIFQFEKCDCTIDIKFTHRQSLIINEKLNLKKIAKNKLVFSTQNVKKQFNFTNINKNQQNQKVKNSEKIRESFKYLENQNKTKKQLQIKVFKFYNA